MVNYFTGLGVAGMEFAETCLMKPTCLLCVMVVLFTFAACSDTEFLTAPDLPDFWEVHHQQVWTMDATADHLLGTWKWTYERCCPESTDPFDFSNREKEEYILQFEPQKLSVYRNGVLIQVLSGVLILVIAAFLVSWPNQE